VSPARAERRARRVAALWVWGLRLQRLTWRLRVLGLERFDADIAARRRLIVAFWHGRYPPLFVLLAGRDAAVFTSRSRRGEVIAEICRRFGYRPVLLADRGGDESLERMREVLAEVPVVGIAVDGPLGPYHSVKRGPVQLAADLGALLYPVSLASSRKRVLAERWDRMELPRPFSRVALVVGEPLRVPAGVPDLTAWQQALGDALAAADRRAEALLTATGATARFEEDSGRGRAGVDGPVPTPGCGAGSKHFP
jgi:hypothetical protein